MITASRPEAFALPSAQEVAALAGAYFPEFGGEESVSADHRGGITRAIPPGRALPYADDAAFRPGAYAPRVLPRDAYNAAPVRETGAPVRPRQSAPLLSGIFIGPKSLELIRADFPILAEKVNGKDLVWMDNAATTQRPRAVIDRLVQYYEHENSNVHRGAHELASRSTDAYEDARKKAAAFIGAPSADNIVFVRGTTEGINLAANAYVKQLLKPGDEIILTMLEHHANIVPWQLIAEETGALLRVAPIDQSGQIILSEYAALFNSRTRFVAAAHVSNALGTIAPVGELIQIAHSRGVKVLIDGAQSVSHVPVNVSALDADFFVFSGHKIFGPTGIGILYGKSDVLEAARPYQGGGNMIADVSFEQTQYRKAPAKFEAGTGNIAGAVGLGAALDYVSGIGMDNIAAWEHELLRYAAGEMKKIRGLRLVGTAAEKASVLSFVLDGHSNEDVGAFLNTQGIAVRAGHHCAQPVLRFFGLEGTVRPSLAFYNTPEEVDKLIRALRTLSGG
ncbi:MAG: cysteine desulfurase [Treponema sp.]|jgi:cysteine desulfurase/selenocysteine lyase|nr:cysteine desulfurase [Treponema sp.]